MVILEVVRGIDASSEREVARGGATLSDTALCDPPGGLEADADFAAGIIVQGADGILLRWVKFGTGQVDPRGAGECRGVEDGVVFAGFSLSERADHVDDHFVFVVVTGGVAPESDTGHGGVHFGLGLDLLEQGFGHLSGAAFDAEPVDIIVELKVEGVNDCFRVSLIKKTA